MPNIVDHDTDVNSEPAKSGCFGVRPSGDTCRQLNLKQAHTFLSLLAGHEPVTFQTFPDRKDLGDSSSLTRVLHGALEDHADQLTDLNSRGAGIFVMVNQGDGRRRRTENVTGVRALFVDLDGSPLEPVLAAPLKPEIVVETSPGRYHVYWKVDGIELREFSHFQTELAFRFGGDPRIKDLPRVMRLPGFFHLKQEPFIVRIIDAKCEAIHA